MKLDHDALLGTLFAAVGVAAGVIALDYPVGTSGRMGPGYFPLIVSALLTLTGLAIVLRGRLTRSEAFGVDRWLPILVVPAAIVLFGLLVERLGLPLAVLILCFGAAAASVKFRWTWPATAGAAAFSAVCALVFVKFLGLPIPIVGTWLQPLAGI